MSDHAADPFNEIKGEPVCMLLQQEDPHLARCAEEAQATLGLFSELHSRHKDDLGIYFGFKTAVRDGDHLVHLWYCFRGTRDEAFMGEHFQLPPGLEDHKRIQVSSSQIEDWMINDHGILYGGLTIRYQRSKLPEHQKASFDEYSGIREYKELAKA